MSVVTVRGPVEVNELGLTLSHEHLYIDLTNQFHPGPGQAGTLERVSPRHRELLRSDPYALRDNLILDDEELAVSEVAAFARAGGRTIVDCTSIGIGRDLERLRRLSERSGVQVVGGSGYYTADTHPASLAGRPEEDIADEICRDLDEGVPGRESPGRDSPGSGAPVRAGIIGEIGVSREMHPFERRVLRAAAQAQRRSGAPLYVHTYPWSAVGLEAAELLISLRVPPAKIVICHVDVRLDETYLLELCRRGVYVEFDDFGKEFTPDASGGAFAGGAFATDAERVLMLARLAERGHLRRLLATTDVCLKSMLHAHGGCGYDHLPVRIAPALRAAGFGANEVDMILRGNPAALFE